MNNEKIFLDMDNTICYFPNADGEQGTKAYRLDPYFFKGLNPKSFIFALNKVIAKNPDKFYILSSSPNRMADESKMYWLNIYLTNLKEENIYFCRPNQEKAQFLIDNGFDITECILFDDYKKNLIPFMEKGGTSVKVVEKAEIDENWKGLQITDVAKFLGQVIDMISE